MARRIFCAAMRGIPCPAAYAIWAPAPEWDVSNFVLFPFFAADAMWSSWDTWCSGSLFLLLMQICRGAFTLRLLLLLLLLLRLLLLLLRLLLLRLTLRMALFFLATPAPANSLGLYSPYWVRPYGCHWDDPRGSCP